MKNAIILHGTGTKNTDFWFPWLKTNLEERGFDVWLPQLPNDEKPNLKEWLPYVLQQGKFTEDTVIVGHSAGSQLILSVLENIDIPIKQAILVSGYAKHLRATASDANSTDDVAWEKVRGKAREFVFINSDNDPWGCDDTQGRIMHDHLGGKQIVLHEGHMGSTTYNEPYKEFPFLLDLIK